MADPVDRGARIRAYFESCNTGDPDEIAAHFSRDAIIWDTNHGPVRPAAGVAEIRQYWIFDRDRLDTGLVDPYPDGSEPSR